MCFQEEVWLKQEGQYSALLVTHKLLRRNGKANQFHQKKVMHLEKLFRNRKKSLLSNATFVEKKTCKEGL